MEYSGLKLPLLFTSLPSHLQTFAADVAATRIAKRKIRRNTLNSWWKKQTKKYEIYPASEEKQCKLSGFRVFVSLEDLSNVLSNELENCQIKLTISLR